MQNINSITSRRKAGMAAYAIAWKCMQAFRRDGNLLDALCNYYVPMHASPTSGCTLASRKLGLRMETGITAVETCLSAYAKYQFHNIAPASLHDRLCNCMEVYASVMPRWKLA